MAKFSLLKFLWDKYRPVPPVVKQDLSGKNVLVVGANTGIGFEAAKHFASMNPAHLYLGCRDEVKGKKAVEAIERATGCHNITLWLVDLNRFSSVVAFADKFEDIALDIVVANAAVSCENYQASPEGWEHTLQVNHLSTTLLCLLLMPRLKDAAEKGSPHPRLVVVSSEAHFFVGKLPAQAVNTPNILETLSRKDYRTGWFTGERYNESKLLNVFLVHVLTSRLPPSSPIIVNCVHPGFCKTELTRQANFSKTLILAVGRFLLAACSSEEGSRNLVWAAIGTPSGSRNKEDGEDIRLLKGAYVANVQVEECSDYALSEEGKAVRERIWAETIEILSKASPKVSTIVQSLNS